MNSANNNCILAKNLLVGWQQNRAICQIDELCLKRPGITVLCGPNGVGKSTLLKTIAKQIQPLAGEIQVDGINSADLSQLEMAKRLAFVPQFMENRRSLSVSEWVALGRNPHQQWWSWTESETDRNKIADAMKRTDCWELKDKTIETLSGGERQRVQIATALAQEPAYMLLDEPTAHLDLKHQLELLALLIQLRLEGLGILLVLHDLSLAARIADEVILLKKIDGGTSRVAAAGTVDLVLSHDILLDVYGVDIVKLVSDDGAVSSYVARGVQT